MIKRGKKSTKQKQEVLLDDLYRDVVRQRAIKLSRGCQCKVMCKGNQASYTYLQTAHMFSRCNHTVRWDIRNAVGVCFRCHPYLDRNPQIKAAFFQDLLGSDEFDKLAQLAHGTTKEFPVDLSEEELELRAILAEL